MKNSGTEITFYNFIKQNSILIPKIQRDYVQGRNHLRIKRNRENFIKDLVNAVCKGNKINLNFVYGYSDDFGNFIPIDGQQRLTTLLLLHSYVFACNNDELHLKWLKEKFSYETRNSSKSFFEALLNNFCKDEIFKAPENLPTENEKELLRAIRSNNKKDYAENKFKLEQLKLKKISGRIENCKWFSARWKQDPTVYSALVVLDEIEQNFQTKEYNDFNQYAQTLIEATPITFMSLRIEEIGKPEELYIKMNARGKQLTDFENFKADLYGKLSNENIVIPENFKIKDFKADVDGDWLNYIWGFFEEDKAFESVDVFYRNIFHWVFTTRLASNVSIIPVEQKETLKAMITESCAIEDCYLEDYCILGDEIFVECLNDFKSLFDLLLQINQNNILTNDIKQQVFGNLINLSYMTFPQRTLMFAIIRYARLNSSIGIDKFSDWWRVFKNLINNTDIDNDRRFCTAITAIEKFEHKEFTCDNIKEIEAFDKRQIAEEYLKIKLKDDSEWNVFISDKEDTYSYFDGRLYFSFRLICNRLEELSTEITTSCYMIDNAIQTIEFDKFKKIWDVLNVFFNKNGLIAKLDEQFKFHRALLTFGDYSINTKDYENDKRYTFFFEGNKGYYNWRRMLRENKSFKIFKSFVEEYIKSQKSIEEFINSRIENYTKNNSQGFENNLNNEMVYYLIKKPELFEYMSKNIFCWDGYNQRIILCAGESLNGKYVEFNTYALKLLLNSGEYNYGTGYFYGENSEAFLIYNGIDIKVKDNNIVFNGQEYQTIEDAVKKLQ